LLWHETGIQVQISFLEKHHQPVNGYTIGISEAEVEERGKAALEAYMGANADPEQLWNAVLNRSDWYREDDEENR